MHVQHKLRPNSMTVLSLPDLYLSEPPYTKLRRVIEHVVPSILPESDWASQSFRERLTRVLGSDEGLSRPWVFISPMSRPGATCSTTYDPPVFNVFELHLSSISTPIGL